MLDQINSFAAANAVLMWSLVAIALAIVALSQQRVRFWVRDFWVTLPWVGSIARLARDTTRGNKGWMRSEEKLCAIYKPFVGEILSESQFNERIEYLRKAADLGRCPTPWWVWLLLAVLIIAEGLGFSYLLGSWMARDGSANIHTLLMLAIVFVLCVILLALTHFAGHQYYRTTLLRACFKRYKNVEGKEYHSVQTSLNQPQSFDNGHPDYCQCANRVAKHSGDQGSYAAGIIAIIAIVVIAVMSTGMRWQSLEAELASQSGQVAQPAASRGNPFDNLTLPADVVDSQKQADKKARSEISSATQKEGLMAFVMLAFIFVITQIVSMGAGHQYGFGGRESHHAYKSTGGFADYVAYWGHFGAIVDLANGRLKDLQQRMEEHSPQKLTLSKAFLDYLVEQQNERGDASVAIERRNAEQRKLTARDRIESTDPSSNAKPNPADLPDKQAEAVGDALTLPSSHRQNVSAPGARDGAASELLDEVLATLEKLHGLVAKGVLSQSEYDAKKEALLKKLA